MSFDFSPACLDAEFPVRKNLVYFNHAAVAPLPRRVAAALISHIEDVRDRGAAGWRGWYSLIETTREKVAAFVGSSRSEIGFVPNTSWGINLVALSFPWKSGDNVVTDDMEFPSNAYPWMALARRGGRDGPVLLARVQGAVERRDHDGGIANTLTEPRGGVKQKKACASPQGCAGA